MAKFSFKTTVPPAPTTDAGFRIEHDSMGEVRVPAQAYYGAQTQRAVENFPISGWPLPPELIHALGAGQTGRRHRPIAIWAS